MTSQGPVFLCGDVMLGRGIDQILPQCCSPELHESYVRLATDYVRLAEARNGRIDRPVSYAYPWGEALAELDKASPIARIVNLETSMTTCDVHEPKGINYRMHPANVRSLKAAAIDCCVLANNHVLDWGREGLLETLEVCERSGIAVAGAGRNVMAACRPAIIQNSASHARVLVYGLGCRSSGIPGHWQGSNTGAGVNLLPDLSQDTASEVVHHIQCLHEPGDVTIVSIHWGPNWGYDIDPDQVEFAHALVDSGVVDIVHGHSSHHAKAIEVYREKPVFYGCGDFINDYEGISGHEAYRGDLAIMYLVNLDAGRRSLVDIRLVPFRRHRFSLQRASASDSAFLQHVLSEQCRAFNAVLTLQRNGELVLY